MTPLVIYSRLLECHATSACDAFDAHVLACILAAGVADSARCGSLADALGLSGKALSAHIDRYFPGALVLLQPFGIDCEITVGDDEQCLQELLLRSRSSAAQLGALLSILIARRSTRTNHLWQDLGLADRTELSALMRRHFAPLASRNTQDMKWKKFFYRMICRDEGFRLCAAPCCAECSDFKACFGDESGESLLARVRFQFESPALIAIDPARAQ